MIDRANPLLDVWSGPFGAPDFALFATEDVLPALQAAIVEHWQELAAICDNPAPADFENSIAALERSGATLARVSRLFQMLASAQATEAIRAIEAEVFAVLSAHESATHHNVRLFARIAAVHEVRQISGLTGEQVRLVQVTYKGFVRGGAALDGSAKAIMADIDARLSGLAVSFGQNVVAATAAWMLVLDAGDLVGLPEAACAAAAGRAETAGYTGRYLFTLDRADYETFLAFSQRRDLREKLWHAFVSRCDGGPYDNWPIIAETLALRTERARLLRFADHAAYVVDDSMAQRPEVALDLLMQLWEPARTRATVESAELQAIIDAEGQAFRLAPWDWRFYAEHVRRDRYALDGAALKAYLQLDAVRTAAFDTASRLYGLRFRRREDIVGYHPDVAAWEVSDDAGIPVGLLYTDYLARPEKHGGAWMGSLRVQESFDGDVRPIVYLVANFASSPQPECSATQLSLDEARTVFHEFGHALHGLLSNVHYPSLAGTAVSRDFVEFPSKFMENWIVSPEVLTKLGVPFDLVDAIRWAGGYGQGFATVELVSCALIDLAFHQAAAVGVDAKTFVAAELARLGMPDAIGLRHRLPCFTHVFDGGYASAYYSYLWSEVLDADAFEAFVATGDIFDPATAIRFRREILAQGDSRDPIESFIAFRGRTPDGQALMRARNLVDN